MDYKKLIDSLYENKRFSDMLGLRYFGKNDSLLCNYVVSQIPSVSFDKSKQDITSIDRLFDDSLIKMRQYLPKETYTKLCSIVGGVPRYQHNGDVFWVNITFKRDYFSNGISRLGTVRSYNVPETLYQDSVISLMHEHCHALKDTNYLEHQYLFIFGEVIPMFFELINYEDDNVRHIALQKRLQSLLSSRDMFLYASNQNCDTRSCDFYNLRYYDNPDYNIYDFAKGYSGVYLNSFYYALILYTMYKETPVKILELISKVLNHDITTFEMLNQLNIYSDINGEVFEKEMKLMKRTLSL